MKQLLKQKSLWIAAAFIVVCIAMAILDNAIYHTPAVISKLEKALNKMNYQKATQCFTPDNQQDALLGIQYAFGFSNVIDKEAISGETYNFITSGEKILEDGSRDIQVYMLSNDTKGICTRLTWDTIHLVNVDGKEYIN